MNVIEGLHFQPYIAPKYGTAEFGKLLLLGESHYFENKEDDVRNLTSLVVKEHIEGKGKSPFFRKAGYAFARNDWREIWNKVAYANLIQSGLNDSKSKPTDEEINTIKPAFKLLVNNLKPDKVIVFSKRMWEDWLPEDGWGKEKITSLFSNGKSSELWEYNYDGGRCLIIGTYHPSTKYFSSEDYFPLIRKFLSIKY